MNRRRFLLTSLAGALAAPVDAGAQTGKVSRVGILAISNPRVYDPFVDELRKLGHIDGLTFDLRSAEGNFERLPTLAADLVRAGVDVILVAGPEASLRAARQATRTIPVVIVAIDYDPLALGYVASLARPGGNVTGVFLQQIELTAKRMELLKAVLPNLTRLAILWDASSPGQFKAAEAAAGSLGIRVQSLEIHDPSEISAAFASAIKDRADAFFVVSTSWLFRERVQIAQLALKNRFPRCLHYENGPRRVA